eukprot:8754307-Ditylum_brightwellii.AAC.1
MDKMPQGLKIQNQANIVLFDSAKTAGVNYDDIFDDDNTYEQDSDEESDKKEVDEDFDDDDDSRGKELKSTKEAQDQDAMDENDIAA